MTSTTDYAVPTGNYIEAWLEENQVSQAELARRMGVSAKHVSKLISGASLSTEVALKLALATGVDLAIWQNFEALYRADLARIAMIDSLSSQGELAKSFPLSHLRKQGIVTATARNPGKVLMELFAFFGVGSIEGLSSWTGRPAVAFRQGTAHPVNPYALATWLRLVELEEDAISMEVSAFDESALREQLSTIRAMSAALPHDLSSALQRALGDAGVTLVFVPEVPGARVFGSTRWVNGTPRIALTLRGKDDGNFWFTLFHELGHVLLHRDGLDHIRPAGEQAAALPAEAEADRFARLSLIPEEFEPKLATLRSKADVVAFAKELGVSPGIVVGRLHHDQLWPHQHGQDLLCRLKFTEEAGA